MEARDRLRSENDYKINLKAELEIRHLHEKNDHLVKQQWQRLVELQQIQIGADGRSLRAQTAVSVPEHARMRLPPRR